MKVMLCWADNSGTGHYRLFAPGKYLERLGHEVTLTNEVHYDRRRMRLAGPSAGHDLIVIQRQTDQHTLAVFRNEQRHGTPVINEVDDWYLGIGDPRQNIAVLIGRMKARNFEAMFRSYAWNAALTCTTPFLERNLARYHKPIYRLPNYLDPEVWEPAAAIPVPDRPVTVGWMGHRFWHGGDPAVLRGVIGPVLARYDARFYTTDIGMDGMVGRLARSLEGQPDQEERVAVAKARLDSPDLAGFRDRLGVYLGIDPALCSYNEDGTVAFEEYPALVRNLDVSLVPLDPRPYNQAKSYLKGLESMALGIPVIATPTEPYRQLIRNGENGFLAKRGADWARYLGLLLSSPDLRAEIGAAGRRTAEAHWLPDHIHEWEKAYQEVIQCASS